MSEEEVGHRSCPCGQDAADCKVPDCPMKCSVCGSRDTYSSISGIMYCEGCSPWKAHHTEELLAKINAADLARRANYPTEASCVRAMMDAYIRLKELGWNDPMYAPEDKTVATISIGSTGIHAAQRTSFGTSNPKTWWGFEAGDAWPHHPILFHPTRTPPDGNEPGKPEE